MSLAENIKRLRKEKGWTQLDLSEQSGLRVAHISEMEKGKGDPKLSTLYKLMDAFGCSPDTLLTDREHVTTNALLKQLLERAGSLPKVNQLAILEVVEKYCIACKVEQEYSDPEHVGWGRFIEMAEILDPELHAQATKKATHSAHSQR